MASFQFSSSTSSVVGDDDPRLSGPDEQQQPGGEPAALFFPSTLYQQHGPSSLSGLTVHPRSDYCGRSNHGEEAPARAPRKGGWKEKTVIAVFYCWASCLLTYLAFALLSPTSLYTQTVTACLPDGRFNIYADSYSPWAAGGTFQITMAYGAISFAQAKVVDVIWDVVVGRLGQVLLAVLSYRTFAAYLTVSLIDAPLSLATFRTIFLKDDSWGASFGPLKDTASRWRARPGRKRFKEGLVMTFMILSLLFVTAFPTLAGAMTGYTATYAAYVKDHAGNYARFTTFRPIVYNISDSRYSQFATAPVVPYYSTDGVEPVLPSAGYPQWDCLHSDPICSLVGNLTQYVIAYNQMSSQDTHLQVGADGQVSFRPRLNITAFWLGADDAEFITTSKLSENGSYHIVSSLNFSGNGVLDTSQLRFTNGWNETKPTFFDLPYIEQWGAASQYQMLLLEGHPDIPVSHRGIIELARTMAEQLAEATESPEKLTPWEKLGLSNKKIGEQLGRVGGGSIRLVGAGDAGFVREEKPAVPNNLVWLDAGLLFWFAAALVIAAGQSGRIPEDMRAWFVLVFGSTVLTAALARVIGPTQRWRMLVATLLWLLCFLVGALATVTKAYRVRT